MFKFRTWVQDSDPNRLSVVKDITGVLGTIPKKNNLSLLCIHIQVHGEAPYKTAKLQGWNAFAKEVARISGGKPMRFELDMDISTEEGMFMGLAKGPKKKLYDHIEKELGPLEGVEGFEFEFKNELAIPENPTDSQNLIINSDPNSIY